MYRSPRLSCGISIELPKSTEGKVYGRKEGYYRMPVYGDSTALKRVSSSERKPVSVREG